MTRALIVAVLLAALAAVWQWREATAADARAEAAEGQRDAFRKALTDTQAARDEETRRADKLQEAINAEHTARLAIEADARRADAAAVSLRDRARHLAAAARCARADPAVAASSPPADAPGDLLADMLGRLDEAAGELAQYADRARLAGQLCESSYEALTPNAGPVMPSVR